MWPSWKIWAYRPSVNLSLYCVEHAMNEVLVNASTVSEGHTVCADHVRAESSPLVVAAALDDGGPQCQWCPSMEHRAYFIVASEPLCIRHAADSAFPDDDMRAHDMAHAAYLRLRADGVDDAY